jgi:hypothetical protein
MEAHSYYFLSKVARGIEQPDNTTVFQFDGEFSTVALDFDILNKTEEAVENLHKLKEEIELLCKLQFGSVSSDVIDVLSLDLCFLLPFPSESKISTHEGGFVGQFICHHELPVTPTSQVSDIKAHAKTMQGELEVTVIADHSHRLFAGRRTVVRFCLVGSAFITASDSTFLP